ncbi:hypothetical protein [Bacillus sp. FJAT-27445]|uniref:hypothetical protein n=1 Tax=Bacillus sp. FJAT-27445 TaxID=1679166 RepID=UPI00074378EC|nr:hypothetical protein [Bacillus sp. FJAT-27445]
MENKLNNLKERMDNTVLNEICFTNEHEQSILRRIEQSNNKKRLFNKFKLAPLLSFLFTSFIFVGIIYFVGFKTGYLNNEQPNLLVERHTANTITKKEDIVKQSIFTPEKQNEIEKDLTKTEILTKMINSVDHFDTAKGQFELHYSNINLTIMVNYELSLRENAGGFIEETIIRNEEKETRSFSYEGSDIDSIPLDLKSAFYVNEQGENETKYRGRPNVGYASNSLFPYELASNYTRDLSSWEIEKQNEEILGHRAVVIRGLLNNYAKEKNLSEVFRLWIDKDSGVLIKYETYNHDGDIVDYLYPTKLVINGPVDITKFYNESKGDISTGEY